MCINPTNLGAAFPHGGTAIGLTKLNKFFPRARYKDIYGEEYGGGLVEKIYAGERPRFACYLRSWDTSAIGHIFHNASGGVVTSDATTDATRSGVALSGNAAKLYFSPLAPSDAPGLLGYVAVPSLEASAEMQFSPSEEIGLAVVWDFLPSSTGKLYQIGIPGSLTL